MKTSPHWQPYPETIAETPLGRFNVEVSTPDHWHVVMGAAGKAEREVHLARLQARGIPLYKRKGGGGTVLLGRGTIVVTVHAGVAHLYKNLSYFKAVNGAMTDVFRGWKDLPFHHRGISDIAVADRKIVGTSIFRRKQYLLYQASILVDLDLPLMEEALQHPPREPDYRAGRDHRAFVTCLRELGIDQPTDSLAEDLRLLLPQRLPVHLAEVDQLPPDQWCYEGDLNR